MEPQKVILSVKKEFLNPLVNRFAVFQATKSNYEFDQFLHGTLELLQENVGLWIRGLRPVEFEGQPKHAVTRLLTLVPWNMVTGVVIVSPQGDADEKALLEHIRTYGFTVS